MICECEKWTITVAACVVACIYEQNTETKTNPIILFLYSLEAIFASEIFDQDVGILISLLRQKRRKIYPSTFQIPNQNIYIIIFQ